MLHLLLEKQLKVKEVVKVAVEVEKKNSFFIIGNRVHFSIYLLYDIKNKYWFLLLK